MTYEEIIKQIGQCKSKSDFDKVLEMYPIRKPLIIPELSNTYIEVEMLLNAKEYILGVKGNHVERLNINNNPNFYDYLVLLKTKEEFGYLEVGVKLNKGDVVQGFAFISGTSGIDYHVWMDKQIGVKGTVTHKDKKNFVIKFPQGKIYRYPTILAHKAIVNNDTIINTKERELKVYLKNTQEAVIFHLPIAQGEMMQERITESKLKVQICRHTSGNYTIYAKGYDMLTILKDMPIPIELSLIPAKPVKAVEVENDGPTKKSVEIQLPISNEVVTVLLPTSSEGIMVPANNLYLARTTSRGVYLTIFHYDNVGYRIVCEGYKDVTIPIGVSMKSKVLLSPSTLQAPVPSVKSIPSDQIVTLFLPMTTEYMEICITHKPIQIANETCYESESGVKIVVVTSHIGKTLIHAEGYMSWVILHENIIPDEIILTPNVEIVNIKKESVSTKEIPVKEKSTIALYNMKLHDVIQVGECGGSARRVPGGWIYTDRKNNTTSVFVPLNNEFQ